MRPWTANDSRTRLVCIKLKNSVSLQSVGLRWGCPMWFDRSFGWARLIALFTGLLLVKVVLSMVLTFRFYFPPDFNADFLYGRESYFFGAYQWAFYAHIVSGPLSLILGVLLVSEWIQQRFRMLHRVLGRVQVVNVLLILVPSGLWMSLYAMSGAAAGLAFAILALATGGCILMGWRCAVQRRIDEHRLWMERCLVLLCSAVVLRLLGGLATMAALTPEWVYPVSAWASWLVPLAAYEGYAHMRPKQVSPPTPIDHAQLSS